jgi:hypothetical protein
MSEYTRHRGDLMGDQWMVPALQGRRGVCYVVFDTNYWKSFVHARLRVALGDRGCLSLFGNDASRHRLLAEHATAEYPVTVQGRGRTVDEWKLRLGVADNHWWDCLVGCAVAASIQGCRLAGVPTAVHAGQRFRRKRQRVRYCD